jgi:poly(3-hydroxyalkanoate) depolymerase
VGDDLLLWRGHRVRVIETGVGEPLLLISGLGCNADMWAPFVEQFRERRIIRFDMPGTGGSSTPFYPVSISSLADLATAVLDHCRASWADVVGFSYGGAVAQQLAYKHADRIRRLVLAATTCGVGAVPGSIHALAVLATPLRFYSRAYFDRVAATLYGGATARDAAAQARHAPWRQQAPPSPYGYGMQVLGAAGWSSLHFLDAIPHETLVILGDDDPLVPVANGHILSSRIPRARLEIVERGGHLFVWDDAENVAARIRAFVDDRADAESASSLGKPSSLADGGVRHRSVRALNGLQPRARTRAISRSSSVTMRGEVRLAAATAAAPKRGLER